MKPSIRKIPFDIYLPATADAEAKKVTTIEVEVYENFGQEFLTTDSSQLIEQTRARYMGIVQGQDIKTLRQRLKLTQDQLSDLLGCGKKSLSRWENGRGIPSGLVNTILRLLDEGFLAPASLAAVQGPRSQPPLSPFFRGRPHNIIPFSPLSVDSEEGTQSA